MLHIELAALNKDLEIPNGIKEAGVEKADFEKVVLQMTEDAMKSGNISVNPRKTDREDILELYRQVFF